MTVQLEPGSGDGVGDKGASELSWAYDGGRRKKWSLGSSSYATHVKWNQGDTVRIAGGWEYRNCSDSQGWMGCLASGGL